MLKKKKLKLNNLDTVIIDLMSNFAFLGTDEDRLPIPAAKSDKDGRGGVTPSG
jgi:hypothetical protein